MEKQILKQIRLIENEIERRLSEEDFISIPALSLELEKLIKKFSADLSDDNFESNSEELEKISRKLEFFKNETTTIFKNYQSKVSAQTKMRLAYQKNSG
tara:strand:- start:358 stop:654 length:297 start_codon:yes stop_codon:yes gene_type:complete